MPSPPPTLSRRRVLASALALVGATAAACGSPPPPPEVDELAAQLDRARADAKLATGAAAQERGPIVGALTAVAAERSAHARALSDELVRMRGAEAPTATATSTTAAPARPPTAKDVVTALRASGESAAELAATLSGYRAGLVASIAAACTASHSVALVIPRSRPR